VVTFAGLMGSAYPLEPLREPLREHVPDVNLQNHVTDSCIRGTGGTVLLSHRWRHTQHPEKKLLKIKKPGPGSLLNDRATKPTHWSWDKPPVGNQLLVALRLPGCHLRGPSACSTLQLTGKSTASKLAENPCAASEYQWSGDSAALRLGGYCTTRTATGVALPHDYQTPR